MILFMVPSYVIEDSWWISNVCVDLKWSIKVGTEIWHWVYQRWILQTWICTALCHKILLTEYWESGTMWGLPLWFFWISEPQSTFWRDHIKEHCMEKIMTWLRLTDHDYIHSSSKALGMKMKPLPEDHRVTLLLLHGALNGSVELCLNS